MQRDEGWKDIRMRGTGWLPGGKRGTGVRMGIERYGSLGGGGGACTRAISSGAVPFVTRVI
jgi:hypothetical protein|eukprot:SAG25_NODE_581_length_6763_cov_168.349490_5_plen_61_part_00